MQDQKTTVPVDSAEASSAATETELNQPVYSKDFVEKLKKEKDNYKKKANDLLLSAQKAEEASMLEKEEFKKLYEGEKSKLEQTIKEYSDLKVSIENTKKLNSLRQELDKLGAVPQFKEKLLGLLPKDEISQIHIDSETGAITGADQVAKTLLETFPPLFGKTVQKVDQSAPKAEFTKQKSTADMNQKEIKGNLQDALKSYLGG
jgi:DNA primase large subunit